jgi:hypothetical protein
MKTLVRSFLTAFGKPLPTDQDRSSRPRRSDLGFLDSCNATEIILRLAHHKSSDLKLRYSTFSTMHPIVGTVLTSSFTVLLREFHETPSQGRLEESEQFMSIEHRSFASPGISSLHSFLPLRKSPRREKSYPMVRITMQGVQLLKT